MDGVEIRTQSLVVDEAGGERGHLALAVADGGAEGVEAEPRELGVVALAGAVDFKALWAAADRERLSRLAGGPEALAEAERCLLNDSAQEALRTSDGEAALA